MARRDLPEINAGSMADIAFLLLIFFLVTTTMDTDGGLTRKLPPMPEEEMPEDDIKIKERNIFEVLVNANDQLLVEGQLMQVSELRQEAKTFIVSDPGRSDLPEFKLTDVPFFGSQYPVSKQIISLQNDRGTSYEMYIKVQNELVAAYNDLRNELAMDKFGLLYDELSEEQYKAIRAIYPQRISEAEPKSIGE